VGEEDRDPLDKIHCPERPHDTKKNKNIGPAYEIGGKKTPEAFDASVQLSVRSVLDRIEITCGTIPEDALNGRRMYLHLPTDFLAKYQPHQIGIPYTVIATLQIFLVRRDPTRTPALPRNHE
jgi:hypothetical protein